MLLACMICLTYFSFFPVIAMFDATLFCGDINSSSFSYSNVIIVLINSLKLRGTFPLLIYTVIKLVHKITYGYREAVNIIR